MPIDELLSRIRRIYASIDVLQEFDMGKLPAKFFQNDHVVAMFQDFTGALSEEDLANVAHTVIHNIANLQDHLRRWAAHNGQDKTKVDTKFKTSQPLKVIQDLSNNDKHGYPPRNNGYSGCAPKLANLRRQMRLTTKAEAGSRVVMILGPRGVPKVSGSGTACAVITADVVDQDGNRIDDLFQIEQAAVAAWEALLVDYAILANEHQST